MKRRIVLLGPPASGKGTQADLLSAKFAIPHVSTGALLRSECARGTTLGLEADSWTRRGLLVPDKLAILIITQWIEVHGTRFLFDGFPRSVAQAEHLDAALEKLRAPLDLIVVLELNDDEICHRIASRLSCLKCGATFSSSMNGVLCGEACPRCNAMLVRRDDDQPEAVEQRLRVYQELTFPVVSYYERTSPHLIHRINAGEGSGEVFAAISKLLA